MERAPYFDTLSEGPEDGAAFWLTAEDGVRVRIAVWGRTARGGTVLLFPGRTEYVEKYGRAAADLFARGLATVAIDWRGQGLADRLHEDPALGHVDHFDAYQRDVRTLIEAAGQLALPRPFYLLAHSMGGAIGLRALYEGLDVAAAAFSAPMWGIRFPPLLGPAARAIAAASRPLGLGLRVTPGTGGNSYVLDNGFDGNLLTGDPEMFDYLRRQLRAQPALGLSGPTLVWVHEALREVRALDRLPAPACAALTFLGSEERIVSPPAIRRRMAGWQDGELKIIGGARHEVMMEGPEIRRLIFDSAADHFSRHRTRAAAE